jgi:hypothetical protein
MLTRNLRLGDPLVAELAGPPAIDPAKPLCGPPDDPAALRGFAAIFDRMTPSDATLAAARALRFMADEIERQGIPAKTVNGAKPVLRLKGGSGIAAEGR